MGVDSVMFVACQQKYTAAEIRKKAVHMATALGEWRFSIYAPGFMGADDAGQHALQLCGDKPEYYEGVAAPEGGCLVECNISTRYYGARYERGDLVTILAVARWLREALAPCVVHYGGDSGGDIEPLDAEREAALWSHFMGPNGRSYFTGRNSFMSQAEANCAFCQTTMYENGAIDGAPRFYCNACGSTYRRPRETNKLERTKDNYDHEGTDIPRHMLRDVLLDLVAQYEDGLADPSKARVITGKEKRCGGPRTELTVETTFGQLTPDVRAQVYERVGQAMMLRASQIAKGSR